MLAVGGATACSGGDDGSAVDSVDGGVAATAGGDRATNFDAVVRESTGALTNATATADDTRPARDIVRSTTVGVRVADVDKAAERAADIAASAGGVVFDQRLDLQGRTRATITLKVPPTKLGAVMGELKALGTVLEQTESSEDVTERIIDLESRLRSARASADRLRGLLSSASTAADVVAIEGELSKREALAESLDAQHRSLQSQVDMAAVTVTLVGKAEAEVSDEIPGFLDGLEAGSVVLLNAGKVALTSVGAMLPFAPFLAALWLAVRWLRRRGRRGTPRPEPV